MKIIRLIRLSQDNKRTIGFLKFEDFECFTLEEPWMDNQRNVSCIPSGTYEVVRDNTGRHKIARVLDVPSRSAIEFHAGNDVGDTQGCILLGYTADLQLGIIGKSRKATEDFRKKLDEVGGRALLIIEPGEQERKQFKINAD